MRRLFFVVVFAVSVDITSTEITLAHVSCELARERQFSIAPPGQLTAAFFDCITEVFDVVGQNLRRVGAARNIDELLDLMFQEYDASVAILGEQLAGALPQIFREDLIAFEQELKESGFIESPLGIEDLAEVDLLATSPAVVEIRIFGIHA